MTAGLTYWRCPECGTEIGLTEERVGVGVRVMEPRLWVWDRLPDHDRAEVYAEQMVEAHEAKHLGGGV